MSTMRSSPFASPRILARIFVKALVLLLILDILLAASHIDVIASLTRINTWSLVGHGRARLIYPSDFRNGQLPVESLVGAHTLAYTPKTADEYRVIVLGSSGPAGWGLPDSDTFSAQLTDRELRINGKRVVAYNLAYPQPHVARDVLILDAALPYHPDLVIWFCGAAAVINDPQAYENKDFFALNRDHLKRITDAFGLQAWYTAWMGTDSASDRLIAVHNQATIPVWLNTLFYPFEAPDLAITNQHIANEPIPLKALYNLGDPGFTPMPNASWDFLAVGQSLTAQAGARLLLVDEPTLVGIGPHSDVNYSKTYQRALHDAYRAALASYATQHHLWYADLWDAIPAANFTDSALHADKAGNAILVDRIAAILHEGADVF